MIGVPQAAAALEAPATTEQELYERLGLYIGQTISMDIEFAIESESVTARLERLCFKTDRSYGKPQSWLEIYLSGVENRIFSGNLRTSYRVLIDGIWKTIHDPRVIEEEEE